MQTIQNSAFKEKAAPVEDVSKILPEVGAVVLNKRDGRLYAADKFGWHRFGDPYSPINLFITYDGVTQFKFTFRAPVGSTLEIHDGDGTVTNVAGNDATNVEHFTNYAEPGLYLFTVVGDINDITFVNILSQPFTTGSIAGLSELPDLEVLSAFAMPIYGDIAAFKDTSPLYSLAVNGSRITGRVDVLEGLTDMLYLFVNETEVVGDVSRLYTMTSLAQLVCNGSNVTFDSVQLFTISNAVLMHDCNFTSRMVDNALQSFVNLSGVTIRLDGNNAKRTAASDAAFAIVDAANTLTVNS